jgi:putative transposase
MQINTLHHCVFSLHYHLVLVTKHRRKCLTAPMLADFVNALKTGTSRRLRGTFASHLATFYAKPVLWSRSYCVLSCGGALLALIQQYIQQQDRPEN